MPTSSANWTFATRYPRAPPSAAAARSGKKGTKNGGVPKHNLQAPKAANRRRGAAAPAVRGLVLPPRMRLDSFPPGRSAAGAPKQSVRPPKPPARRLSPAELLAQAENTEKQRRWKEKMAQHDAKFAMHDLGRASAAAEAARRVAADRIRANRDFFSMTAAGEDGGGGLDAGREAGLDGGLAPPPETAAHRESSSSARDEGASTVPLLRKDVLNSICAYLGSVRPVATPVQALAIPASLSPDRDGRALVVGAETGSGKTLAYLVPIIQRLKEAEDDEARRLLPVENVVDAVAGHMALAEGAGTDQPVDLGATEAAVKALAASGLRRLRRPRAIVLVPSRELVNQVTAVAKSLCAHGEAGGARLAVVGLHARPTDRRRLADRFGTAPVDLLVATPAALLARVRDGELGLSRVGELVVDEADTLMDDGFAADLDAVLVPMWEAAAARERDAEALASLDRAGEADTAEAHRLRRKLTARPAAGPPLVTYVSATLPVSMTRRVARQHASAVVLATPALHRTAPRLRQQFLRFAGARPERDALLLDVLRRAALGGDRRLLVFCNTRAAAAAVAGLLRDRVTAADGDGAPADVEVALLTADSDPKARDAALSAFRLPPRMPPRRMLEAAAAAAAGDGGDGGGGNGALANREVDVDDAAVGDGLDAGVDVETGADSVRGGSGSGSGSGSGGVRILVATDVASRGLDTLAADHV
ncbi:hypothetical protein HK405_010376, partial [Cladochytrium tenue]